MLTQETAAFSELYHLKEMTYVRSDVFMEEGTEVILSEM
jgi:hypothetical protein